MHGYSRNGRGRRHWSALLARRSLTRMAHTTPPEAPHGGAACPGARGDRGRLRRRV